MTAKLISELTIKYPLDGTEWIVAADASTGVAYKSYSDAVVYAGIQGGKVYPIAGSFAYQPTGVTLSANTNNLGIGANTLVRLSSTGNYDLTGIVPLASAETNVGRVIYLLNVGANNISLKNEDALSTAANRFVTHNGSHITLSANHLVMALYDGSLSRWRIWDLT